MIVTFTPNPSLDKTLVLDAPLRPGAVQRAVGHSAEPGGKGVNISRALTAAGTPSLAVLPGDARDPVLLALQELDVPARALPIGAPLRTNTAITDHAGVTTKINEPGPEFDAALTESLLRLLLEASEGAAWVALAGSLPPGVPVDFYAQAITALRETFGEHAPRIALDTSGAPLAAALKAAPDLIKPNAEELLELHAAVAGPAASPASAPASTLDGEVNGPSIDEQAQAETLETDPLRAAHLALELQGHGARACLVTLGAHGAVLIPHSAPEASHRPAEALRAWGPPIIPRSTVGAGDASLAGFLASAQAGSSPTESLKQAMAMGRAAAELSGSTMPTPDQLITENLSTEQLILVPSTTTTANVETS
ncbi:1-phosphofructokinase family hexose kinase [Nesterenkonia lutea]|uniref:1-phosphofructokinase n=1 Tax=Nesterenkonia lutea TaxID=272919 RepID=A0ABR9JBA0_9MICC|nr:PfkB family carbohydrate kinase [Nesterenkonia lutea]MBE1523199.1 1-phosphofructokinase [Nesterenkonia lutea]